MQNDPLAHYRAKRNFDITAEPADGGASRDDGLSFVVQKHWASRLHYDLRLEIDGTMKSWAVPKGPSFDPKDKRMAVQVEDHPMSYNRFEGEIPKGQYGAGRVIVWDEGLWVPVGDAAQGWRSGMLKFTLHGHKLRGQWALIRMKERGEKQPAWLLIKEKDSFARPASEFSVVDALPDRVVPSVQAAPAKARRGAAARPAAAAKSHAQSDPQSDPHIAGRALAMTLPGIPSALPDALSPQLATLADRVPADPTEWLFEIKFDGYRMLARIEGASVRLFTRNGHDWTIRLPHLVEALRHLPVQWGWLDGEIVVPGADGIPSFQQLQNALDDPHRRDAIVFYLFDVPYLGGRDLRAEPLTTRRRLLQLAFDDSTPAALRFSEAFDVPPDQMVASACRMGLEGIVGKRRDSRYTHRRSDSWIKLKCHRRQEFVVIGYTAPQGARIGFGALLLAVHDGGGALRYAGNVGTGFDRRTLAELKARMDAIPADRSPLAEATGKDRGTHWVQPVLVAEVAFGEWTESGRIRHAVFHGLRTDKPARAIVHEQRRPIPSSSADRVPGAAASASRAQGRAPIAATGAVELEGVRISHPERVIDASSGLTKLDLARYYQRIAPWLLAHLKARPVSMVRAPDGIDGALFFQKHLEGRMPGVRSLDPALDPGHAPLMEVPDVQAVLSASQMNVVEFHTWNAVKSAIDRPDRMTFDLDPGDGVPWSAVQRAATLVQALLAELDLVAYLKTSGGKGLHLVVPIQRHYGWDVVKAFSHAVVSHLAQTLPRHFVAKSGPANRRGKIYVDYLRNGFGATTVSAWSARARPGVGVSVPIEWSELGSIDSGAHWTVATIAARLEQGDTVWTGYRLQPLGRSMQKLGFDPNRPP